MAHWPTRRPISLIRCGRPLLVDPNRYLRSRCRAVHNGIELWQDVLDYRARVVRKANEHSSRLQLEKRTHSNPRIIRSGGEVILEARFTDCRYRGSKRRCATRYFGETFAMGTGRFESLLAHIGSNREFSRRRQDRLPTRCPRVLRLTTSGRPRLATCNAVPNLPFMRVNQPLEKPAEYVVADRLQLEALKKFDNC